MTTWELTERFIYTVPLKASHRRIAQQLSENKLTATQARNFYNNILAVCAVKDYLEMLGYETDWENSDFLNPAMATFADVADLELKNYGKLECRAVLSDRDIQVPADAWQNRIGYIFVGMDESQQEQHILGYLPSVAETEGVVSLARLHSLDELPEYLSLKEQPEVARQNISESVRSQVIIIKNWLRKTQSAIEQEWQNAEDLLARQPQHLSYRASDISKAKLIDLRMNLASQKVMLLMTVNPSSEEELQIRTRLCPIPEETHLPANLKLEILSELDEPLKEVRSQAKDVFIQLPEFTGEAGEKFKLKISLNGAEVTEEFIV
jgi:hypothetical protein